MLFLLNYAGISQISAGIKFFTWGNRSHTSISQESGETIEAWHKGGVIKSEDPWTLHTPGTLVSIRALMVSEKQSKGIWNFLEGEVGKGYDFRALAGFIPMTRWAWRDNPDLWFCSHLAAKACEVNNYPLFAKRWPLYKVSPTSIESVSELILPYLGVALNFEQYKEVVGAFKSSIIKG